MKHKRVNKFTYLIAFIVLLGILLANGCAIETGFRSQISTDEQKAVQKVVEAINRKRQKRIEEAYDPQGIVQSQLTEEKRTRWYQAPVGKAGWQKVATIPIEVDQWFVKMYGEDYYKDPDFFTKRHPEWRVTKDPRGTKR